jgi:hypothetical protein
MKLLFLRNSTNGSLRNTSKDDRDLRQGGFFRSYFAIMSDLNAAITSYHNAIKEAATHCESLAVLKVLLLGIAFRMNYRNLKPGPIS